MSNAIGSIGTLLVHFLAIQSVMLGFHAHKVHPPEAQGAGASALKADMLPSTSLVLIEIPQETISQQSLAEEFASAGKEIEKVQVRVISDDSLPYVEIPKENPTSDTDTTAMKDSGDPAVQAAMFGRYTGQISARIERVWRRPRSPINPSPEPVVETRNLASSDAGFQCQVRIIQDAHGNIQEVQLLECNGSIAWQHSLIVAINASSPLPAPPTPRVFSQSLTMTFSAEAYSRTSAPDEYELPSTLACTPSFACSRASAPSY